MEDGALVQFDGHESSERGRDDELMPGEEAEIVGEDFDVAEYLAEGDAETQYMTGLSSGEAASGEFPGGGLHGGEGLAGSSGQDGPAEDGPRVNYTEFEGGPNGAFNQVVLEESFVLNLKTTMSFVDFKMNFAVNANYPLPAQPEEGMDYAFRRGRIFFPNMEQVRWQSRIQPYIDPASGSVDYGAIDCFYRIGDNGYYLAGYWGEIEITCGAPILEIDELKDQPRTNQSTAQPAG